MLVFTLSCEGRSGKARIFITTMEGAEKESTLDKINKFIIGFLEDAFEKWGRLVATHPLKIIFASLFLTIACGSGLSQFWEEFRADKIYFPQDSTYLSNKAWLKDHFPRTIRPQIHLWERVDGGNILTKGTLLLMLEAHRKVIQTNAGNLTWNSQCYRIPIANLFITKKRKKRQVDSDEDEAGWGEYDLSDYESFYNEPEDVFEDAFTKTEEDKTNEEIANKLPPEILCDLVNTLNEKCLENSILEIWKFDEQRIQNLTQQDIINAINRYTESPVYGFKYNYTDLLGTCQYNSTGHVVGAKAIRNIFLIERDPDLPLVDPGGGAELEHADALSLAWEEAYLKDSFELQERARKKGLNLYVLGGRSYNDITAEALNYDLTKLAAGYLVMFVYCFFMLGRLNMVEVLLFVTIAGFFSIIMGIVIAYGIFFYLGFPFTQLMRIMPFLCLGVGIDDMFVIVQCYYNLQNKLEGGVSIIDIVGNTLKHSGVAILVTSVTDVFAFAIGMVTIIPGLQAFCFGCAVGIFSIFLLQLSWFVAWFSIDLKRVQAVRNGLFPCYKHKNWTPSKCSRIEFGRKFMRKLGAFTTSKLGQVTVLLVTFVLAGFGLWGSITMPTEFDLLLFLPQGTYLADFFNVNDRYFPIDGVEVGVYTGAMPDPEVDLPKLDNLIQQIEKLKVEEDVVKDYEAWWTDYKDYMRIYKGFDNWKDTIAKEANFSMHLSNFLFSPNGAKYKNNFQFEKDLVCGEPVSEILVSFFSVTYRKFDGPTEHIPGRKTLDDLIADASFTSKSFSFDKKYAEWEIDTVIGFELWRNLALAMVAVFVVTLILLAHFQLCLMVFSCVLLTMMDMIGFLNFSNTTIDTVSCIFLILSIGLCVDYSAHIAHSYQVQTGTKQERARKALIEIGPAVLNGGITTFLAIVFLGTSLTHVFKTFFKVFSFAVLFGLFHGLIALPCFLSLFGPKKIVQENPETQHGIKMSNASGFENRAIDKA